MLAFAHAAPRAGYGLLCVMFALGGMVLYTILKDLFSKKVLLIVFLTATTTITATPLPYNYKAITIEGRWVLNWGDTKQECIFHPNGDYDSFGCHQGVWGGFVRDNLVRIEFNEGNSRYALEFDYKTGKGQGFHIDRDDNQRQGPKITIRKVP